MVRYRLDGILPPVRSEAVAAMRRKTKPRSAVPWVRATDPAPRVVPERYLTLTLPEAGYGMGGRYDVSVSLSVSEAEALASDLIGAAKQLRAPSDDR